jgi:threonine 3-dehydrogenase
MKALVKAEAAKGIWLRDVPEPGYGINDVLVKIRKTAICGTDVHIYNWDPWAQRTIHVPMVVGHEWVGEILAVGSNVTDKHPGELVSGEGHIVCGLCRNCLAGRRHLCKSPLGVGVNRDGAFAELLVIPAANIWHADPGIAPEVLCCFDPLGNATHTALSFDLTGEDVLVTGAGPIGAMSVAIARHCGARFIVVTDFNDYRLRLASAMGADLAVNLNDSSIDDAMRVLGMKEGFDVGFEMSGSPEALNDMVRTMSHGGKIALLGLQSGKSPVDWDAVIFNGLTIKGIYGREMFESWYKMTAMIQSGLDISPLITHRYHYREFQKAFEVMASGSAGKVVLSWSE